MSDEELRRWAIEQVIAHHKGMTSEALIAEANRLIAFVKPEPAKLKAE
jgi:hypothetical protein